MDHKLLGKELGELLEYPVGIKYRVIRLGDYAKAEPIGHKTKAAHVEVDMKDSSLARQHLSKLYSSSADCQRCPFGIRLRFIPSMDVIFSLHTVTKIAKLRARQATFRKPVQQCTTAEISILDGELGDSGCTLRDLLMSLMCSNNNIIPLFHSINKGWGMHTGSLVFSYVPAAGEAANTTMSSLLPLMKYKYPSLSGEITKCFTLEAQARSAGASWDVATNGIKGPSDAWVADIESSDQYLNFGDVVEEIPGELENTTGKNAGESDSVATLRTSHSSGAQKTAAKKKPAAKKTAKDRKIRFSFYNNGYI